jgi:hypothetical protein
MGRVLTLRAVFVVVGLLLLTLLEAAAVVPRRKGAAPPVQVRMSPLFGYIPSTLTVQRGTIVTCTTSCRTM